MKINNLIIDTKIAGQFNVYNLLATFSVASELTNYPIHLNMSLLKKVLEDLILLIVIKE